MLLFAATLCFGFTSCSDGDDDNNYYGGNNGNNSGSGSSNNDSSSDFNYSDIKGTWLYVDDVNKAVSLIAEAEIYSRQGNSKLAASTLLKIGPFWGWDIKSSSQISEIEVGCLSSLPSGATSIKSIYISGAGTYYVYKKALDTYSYRISGNNVNFDGLTLQIDWTGYMFTLTDRNSNTYIHSSYMVSPEYSSKTQNGNL